MSGCQRVLLNVVMPELHRDLFHIEGGTSVVWIGFYF
jgi:hypothetical protein